MHKKQAARPLLFPLAALYAALILPLSLLSMLGNLPFAALASPSAHAHELIFGMALLVIAGYLFGQPKKWQLWLFIGLWLIARLVFFSQGFGLLAGLASGATAAWLAYLIAPPFWRAKRWANKSVALVLVAFACMAFLTASQPQLFNLLITNNLVVLSGLIFFMGGRILAPLLASFWLARKVRSPSKIQPEIEKSVLALLGIALVINSLPLHWQPAKLAQLSLIAAGVLTWVRVLRWQPWQFWPSKDLIFLFIGYGFLATGLLFLGLQSWWLTAYLLASHTLFIGAMALLMVVVMARVSQIKVFKQLKFAASLNFIAGLILLTAIARLTAALMPSLYLPLIYLAAVTWVLAFSWLFVLLIKCTQAANHAS